MRTYCRVEVTGLAERLHWVGLRESGLISSVLCRPDLKLF